DYPTDAPYAEIDGEIRLAVGRLPARTSAELAGVIDKIVRYETSPVTSAWPRRIALRAGTADFGAFTDAAIERSAAGLLGEVVPYDFDLSVTFAKAGSSYMNRPDRLGASLREEANRGALFFAYVGHSGKKNFQSMQFGDDYYSLGDSTDFAEMAIREGA